MSRLVLVLSVLAALLATGCGALPGKPPADSRTVLSGTITYRPRIALSPEAVVRVWLQDLSDPRSPVPVVLDTQTIRKPGQVPISFAVRYDPATIDATRRYALLVKIYEGDRTRFVNARPVDVITRGCTANCVIVVDLMN